jgi:hypothetical protein
LRRIWRSHGHVRLDHDGHLEPFLLHLVIKQVDDAVDHRIDRKDLVGEVEATGFDLGKVEDVVDDRHERLAAAADRIGHLALGGVEGCVEEEGGHPDDTVHRSPDLVTHRREEIALGAVRRLGLFLRGEDFEFDPAPHDELPDLVADAIHDTQERFIGLLDAGAEEFENAEHLFAVENGKSEGRVKIRRRRKGGPGTVGTNRDILDPLGFSGGPDMAGETFAYFEQAGPGMLHKRAEIVRRVVPEIDEFEMVPLLIDHPEDPDPPAEALGGVLDDAGRGRSDRAEVVENARDGQLELATLVVAATLGHVALDRHEVRQFAVGIVHGL